MAPFVDRFFPVNMQTYLFDISWTIRGCSPQIRSKCSTCHKNYINALLWWIGKSFYFRKMEFQMTSRLIGIYGRRPNHTEAQHLFEKWHLQITFLCLLSWKNVTPLDCRKPTSITSRFLRINNNSIHSSSCLSFQPHQFTLLH